MKPSEMEIAAIALLDGCFYGMGKPDDHFAFAGDHENGCIQLLAGGLAENHPYGALCFSHTHPTLTSSGVSSHRAMYRLTREGKQYAERVKAAHAGGSGSPVDNSSPDLLALPTHGSMPPPPPPGA